MFTPEILESSKPSKLKSEGVQPSGLTWTSSGLADTCEIQLEPYKGVDFSKMAFVFCGQGQMSHGLMAEYARSGPIFQARFKELDEIAATLGVDKPSNFVLNPQKSLPKNIESMHSALCLFTLQISMFETLLSVGFYPHILSAHSFGEFAQMTASGMVSFRDMVAFLIERQRCLDLATGKYAMFAVNNSKNLDLSILKHQIYVANVNTRFQTSYVCEEKDFVEIRQILKAQRVACVQINVDYPFHTPWLEPAQQKLIEILAARKMRFSEPKIPFVSSVGQQIVSSENFSPDLALKLLTDQLMSSVHFPKQLEKIQARGIMHFFEISPADVLSSFIEQVFEADAEEIKLNSFRKHFKSAVQSKKSYEKLKSSKFFSALDGALKALTGYSIEHIQLEDRIREDLGIDSIKKAEIVFEIIDVLNQHQIVTPTNLSDLSTFGDILEYFETSKLASEKDGAKLEAPKVVAFKPRLKNWIPAELVDLSSSLPPNVLRVDLKQIREGQIDLSKASVSDLLVFECGPDFMSADFLTESQWWLEYFQNADIKPKRWVLLNPGSKMSNAMDSFFTSFAQEVQVSYKSILTKEQLSDRTVYLESIDFHHVKVRYQNGVRSVRDFSNVAETESDIFKPKRVLAFGGLGGIGFNLLQTLDSIETLIVFGRKVKDVDVEKRLSLLKADRVEYVQLDAEDSAATLSKIEELTREFGEFDFAMHSVGVENSELLKKSTAKEFESILKGKITLARVLADLSARQPKMKVIFNSSIVSEFGNRGQCAYAMANSYLNDLADHSSNIVSLLWPGWDQVGVAAQSINAKSLKLQGLTLMSAQTGKDIFTQVAGRKSGSICIIDQNSLIDYAAIGQSRHEFFELMKPASRNYSLFVIPGLTQARLPYLKDHLIKKMCIFPASGSLSLMLFRAYIERGQLGNIKNFAAHNFLVVGAENSGVTIETLSSEEKKIVFQMKSHQLLSQGEVVFEGERPVESVPPFHATFEGVTDFDNNAAVYTGPGFELMKKSFGNKDNNQLLVELDLHKAPRYFDIPFIDKMHKLLEISFSAPFAKVVIDHCKFTLPKAVESIEFFNQGLNGLRFFSIVEDLKQEGGFFRCNVTTVNEQGIPALVIKNYKSLIVGESKTAKTEGYRITHKSNSFLWDRLAT